MSSLIIKVQPTEEPLTLAEAQAHLRVDSTDDDNLIEGLITAAREYCEETQGRAYVTRTYEYTVDLVTTARLYNGARLRTPEHSPALHDVIELPMPKHQEVTAVVSIDADGVQTAVSTDDYTVDYDQICALVKFDTYPADAEKLKITYTAGYGAAADVPKRIKQMLLLLIGHWYEHRETAEGASEVKEIPYAVNAILSLDRVNWGT
ncbi:MAG: head-tail connector protein [Armatimonadota bacterium]